NSLPPKLMAFFKNITIHPPCCRKRKRPHSTEAREPRLTRPYNLFLPDRSPSTVRDGLSFVLEQPDDGNGNRPNLLSGRLVFGSINLSYYFLSPNFPITC